MYRFPRLAMVLLLSAVATAIDPDMAEPVGLTLLDVGELDDDTYKEVFGYDRHGNFHLREGEELEGDDGWAGDLDPDHFGSGSAAGSGGND